MLVPINIALRSAATWKNVIYHSAYSEPDNSYPDYARQNADDLAEMLRAQGTVGRSAPVRERDGPSAQLGTK